MSESARVLAVSGRVVPSTVDMVELVARFADGREVHGETALAADGAQCQHVRLDPPDPAAHPRALQAIARADAIVMGPGSLFTSTLPPLLVPGIAEAVRTATVPRIYVCNLLQQPGETEGYRASDHVSPHRRPRRARAWSTRSSSAATGPSSARRSRSTGAGLRRLGCTWSAAAWPASGSTTPTGSRACSCGSHAGGRRCPCEPAGIRRGACAAS